LELGNKKSAVLKGIKMAAFGILAFLIGFGIELLI